MGEKIPAIAPKQSLVLEGSWHLVTRVISKATISYVLQLLVAPINKVLVNLLTKSLDPPSSGPTSTFPPSKHP